MEKVLQVEVIAKKLEIESAFSRYEKDLEMRGWKLAKKEEIK